MKLVQTAFLLASLTFTPSLVYAESLAPAGISVNQPATAWSSVITVQQLKSSLTDPHVVVIDARKADDYAKGHIPGAINLPGSKLRTPSAKPAESRDAQSIFLKPDGTPDIAKYEKTLSAAGVTRDHRVIIYGNHAGTADGSIAALIFHFLGHEKVQFIDGIGLDQWTAAGFDVTSEPTLRPTATYTAKPIEKFVWSTDDVLANLDNKDVIFYDTRSQKEYTGEDKRDNARGGHIPGAVWLDYAAFLNKDKTTVALPEIKAKLAAAGITPEKKIVLYCQTATRVSLPLLALKDLGYKDVVIYDVSWQDYGNRADTPVVEGTSPR